MTYPKRLVFLLAIPLAVASITLTAQQPTAERFDSQNDQGDNGDHGRRHRPRFDPFEATIPEMQGALESGRTTSRELVRFYLERIRAYEGTINPYVALNPHAMQEAAQADHERRRGHVRGPLHGIPIALKDNMHADGMRTTGGALAFERFRAPYEATLVRNLRRQGAIILGKTVLTELANWVTSGMVNNYSAVGGYGINPYDARLDPRDVAPFNDGRGVMNTGGSSSGIATTANLAAANVGTETSGSILSPSNQTMLAGIKPTTGLISRWGIIPIAAEQDTAGPMGRHVADAAVMLGAMTGFDPRDPATAICPVVRNYRRYLRADGLAGARIGVPAMAFYNTLNTDQRAVVDEAIDTLVAQGATVEFVEIPTAVSGELQAWGVCASLAQGKGMDDNCSVVLKYGFKRDFNAYLRTLGRRAPVRTLADLIAFNTANEARGAIKYGQQRLDISEEMDLLGDAARLAADRAKDLDINKTRGIDAAIDDNNLDALLFGGSSGAGIAARPGYPSVIVPSGFVPNVPPSSQPPFPTGFEPEPQPYGVMFTGKACTEGRLIELAYAYEQASNKRVPPASAPPLR